MGKLLETARRWQHELRYRNEFAPVLPRAIEVVAIPLVVDGIGAGVRVCSNRGRYGDGQRRGEQGAREHEFGCCTVDTGRVVGFWQSDPFFGLRVAIQ